MEAKAIPQNRQFGENATQTQFRDQFSMKDG
jgi:hypothetical protein